MKALLTGAQAPVVAVSPLVGGHSLKDHRAVHALRRPRDHGRGDRGALLGPRKGAGRRPRYAVRPASTSGMVLHQTETLMRGAEGRARLAAETLDFAQSLAD